MCHSGRLGKKMSIAAGVSPTCRRGGQKKRRKRTQHRENKAWLMIFAFCAERIYAWLAWPALVTLPSSASVVPLALMIVAVVFVSSFSSSSSSSSSFLFFITETIVLCFVALVLESVRPCRHTLLLQCHIAYVVEHMVTVAIAMVKERGPRIILTDSPFASFPINLSALRRPTGFVANTQMPIIFHFL